MSGRGRALVIGVGSTTFHERHFPRLDGVRHDVASVSKLLSGRGFTVTAPTHPSDLTVASVAKALIRTVDATEPGDVTVLYLTGHGYRLRDRNRDEVDGWDEAFVCGDGPILDDWFREELWPRCKSGTMMVAVVDACHSETAVLGLRIGPRVEAPTTVAPTANAYHRLVLAACRDYKTTLDVASSDSGGGVVTTEMLAVLEQDATVSYKSLWPLVASHVRDRYPDRRIGLPVMDSLGPDDSLCEGVAFRIP